MPDIHDDLELVRTWAERKCLGLDVDLLSHVVELHVMHGGQAVGDWPAGSVDDLLLEAWPHHGGVMPDQEGLAATLETYWRWLRATGRLSYRSATVDALLDELRRSAPLMADLVPLVDPSEVAADVRRGAFVQRCLALAAWVGSRGKRVTPVGVLGLEDARTAYRDLALAAVTGGADPRPGPEHQPSLLDLAQEVELAQQRPLAGLRSAADVPVLHEVWQACLDSGLITILELRAYGAAEPPDRDWAWQTLGTDLAISRLVTQDEGRSRSYLFALWPQADHEWSRALGAGLREDGTVSRRGLTKAWWRSLWNTDGASSLVPSRARSDHDFRAAVDVLTDLGVWGRDGDVLTGTAWGRQLVEELDEIVDMPDPFEGGVVEYDLPGLPRE